jgi:hypothetical protein
MTYASAADQLSPAGYKQVWKKLYSTPGPNQSVLVETVDFQTATVLGTVIGSTANMVSKLQSEAKAHGSDMYGLALYHKKVSPIKITIPKQLCIGPLCVNVPGGGATVFATDEYRLVGVHSQFQWALVAIGFALAFGIVMFVITNLSNLQGVFSNISSDFAKAFGGGQASAITGEFIAFTVAGLVLSVGTYLILRDITQTTGLSATAVRPPQPPGIPRLSAPSPNVSIATPYGGGGFGVGGTSVGVGPSGGGGRRPRVSSTRQRRAA